MSAKDTADRMKPAESEKKKKQKNLKRVKTAGAANSQQDTKPKKRKREAQDEVESPPKKPKSDKRKNEKPRENEKEPKPKNAEELEIDVNLPAPPSKKALRLRKKGKPMHPSPTASQPSLPTLEVSKADNTTHPDRKKFIQKEPQRAEFSIWIGNLAYSTDVKALSTWLAHGLAKVEDSEITRVHLPMNAMGQSKGYRLALGIGMWGLTVDLRIWMSQRRKRWRR
jgi:hypothetical protein